MQIEVLLIANAFFLAAVLVILLAVVLRGSYIETESKVKEDLKKIKAQIEER
jgi:hypothetical protein